MSIFESCLIGFIGLLVVLGIAWVGRASRIRKRSYEEFMSRRDARVKGRRND